jgi:hypothetical protein
MHRRGNDRTLVASVLGSALLWVTMPAHACTADNAIRGDDVASAEELLALPGLPRVLRVRAEMGDGEFDSLDELPRPVTRAVMDALRDRLGDELSARAQFILGRIVVPTDGHAGPSSRRPFGYRLRFRVGLSVPCFILVEADDTGALSAPIAYPDVRRNAARQRVLSLEEVLERAFSPDFGRRKLQVFETGLVYHAPTDELVWRIAIHRGRAGRALDLSEIMISAHTGLIVDIRNAMIVD